MRLVVDLRHWMLPSGALEPRARLGPYIARIVECATAVPMAGVAAMLCRHHRTRRRCTGRIGVEVRGEMVIWACTGCDDGGTVSGWQGSHWDLREVDVGPDDEELAIYLPLEELATVRELDLGATVRAVLAGAPVVLERACVPLTETEAMALKEAVESADARGRKGRLLDRTQGRLDQVLAAHQLPRRARAH